MNEHGLQNIFQTTASKRITSTAQHHNHPINYNGKTNINNTLRSSKPKSINIVFT